MHYFFWFLILYLVLANKDVFITLAWTTASWTTAEARTSRCGTTWLTWLHTFGASIHSGFLLYSCCLTGLAHQRATSDTWNVTCLILVLSFGRLNNVKFNIFSLNKITVLLLGNCNCLVVYKDVTCGLIEGTCESPSLFTVEPFNDAHYSLGFDSSVELVAVALALILYLLT